MGKWKATVDPDDPESLLLDNGRRTRVTFSRRVSPDVFDIFARLDSAGVPLSYSEYVAEIYFTLLPGDKKTWKEGDWDSKESLLRVSCVKAKRDSLHRTLIHELGHVIDDQVCISVREEIIEEKKSQALLMPDDYANSAVMEYVAVGFEEFYLGDRGRLRREHPRLYSAIASAHRSHLAKSRTK